MPTSAPPAPASRSGAAPDRSGPSDSELAQALLDATSAIRRRTRRRGQRPQLLSQLTGAQLELLRLVRLNPDTSVVAAAGALRLAPNTVSTLVGELTQRGVMVRRSDSSDRRIAHLELSPEARQQTEAWLDRRTGTVAAALSRLPRSERGRLLRALPALVRLADAIDQPGDS